MLRNIITCIAECAYEYPCSHLFAALPRKTKPRVKLEHTLATANIDRTCTRYA